MKAQNQWLFEAPFPSTAVSYKSPCSALECETEWLFETPGITPKAPSLVLKPETAPTGLTLYVKFPLGYEKPARPMTGIFIPPNYKATSKVDLILYLHGLNQQSINRIWNASSYPYFAFREGVTTSNKNVILVAPTLGPRPNRGERLIYTPGGFDAYLDYVMASLGTYGSHQKLGQNPTVGNIILACHSAGGHPMRKLALLNAVNAAKIRECWGFDCTYDQVDAQVWAQWAKANPSKKLYVYYRNVDCSPPKPPYCSTKVQAVKLCQLAMKQNLRNVQVKVINKGHNYVPITYWEERIRASPFLRNR